MYTLCSHCHTTQEVTPEDLARGRGQLRCQHCGEDFDALEHLSREPPVGASPFADPAQVQETLDFDAIAPASAEPTPEPAPPLAPASDHASLDITVDHIDIPPDDETAHAEGIDIGFSTEAELEIATEYDADDSADAVSSLAGHVQADEQPDDLDTAVVATWFDQDSDDPADAALDEDLDAYAALATPPPSFIPAASRPARSSVQDRQGRRWFLVTGLALVLLVQCIVSEQAQLSADARWRPWMERACTSIGCSLPTWHDPHAMHVLTRDVRPHPSVSDALLISASFRNEARWPQHWPKLELTLSNLDGNAIASREFSPSEYLGLGASEQTIQAGQTASITLEVRDPGRQAVAFEFDFR